MNRQVYLDRTLKLHDTDLIKVETGVLRCGKSSLLGLARNKIASEGVEGRALARLPQPGEQGVLHHD